MTPATPGAGESPRIGDETRSLLRALLLGWIVEHRGGTDDHPSVRDAERALAGLAAGTYGTCEGCGTSVPLDLLLVTPHVQRCRQCTGTTAQARATLPYERIVIAVGAGAAALSAVDDLIVRPAPAPPVSRGRANP